jgi:hypothetical protein
MLNKKIFYNLINKIYYNNIIHILPKFLKKRIRKKFQLYFVPTPLKDLPNLNYPISHSYEEQKEYLESFRLKNKQQSFMTYPHLIGLLLSSFKKDDEFSFLDIGGENIDFYLELKREFKHVKYYIFNQSEILNNLNKLKINYSLKDFNIIYDTSELYQNNYEFINFGSSLHYFENYIEILKNIIKVSKKYVFFSGTHFYRSKSKSLQKHIIVKQVNVITKFYYCYFIDRKFFLETFVNKGFFIAFEKKNLTDNVNYKNFNHLVDDIMFTDILLNK